MSASYTELPYVFDLLYDVKTVESLHDHLTGRRRLATSGTDAQLIALARENGISLPADLAEPNASLAQKLAEALEVLKLIHAHTKDTASPCPVDSSWLTSITAEVLAKNGVDLSS